MELKDITTSKSKDPQSRGWMLTINFNGASPLTEDALIELIQMNTFDYACFAFEKGEQGTLHVHIYIHSENPRRFSTMKMTFPRAHIEKALGSPAEIRDYIKKDGKWKDSEKAETSIPGTFRELGKIPTPGASRSNNKNQKLLEDITAGKSTAEIIKDSPDYIFKINCINTAREELLNTDHQNSFRDVTVYYVYGATGTGKTYSIYQCYDAKDICRITDYPDRNKVRFDAYMGQKVLVLEEFRSEIPISSMLNYLDRYPLKLPARYYDRQACFTTVIITSNIPLEEQYLAIQDVQPETWRALIRRINYVRHYNRNGVIDDYTISADPSGKIIYHPLLRPGVSDAPEAFNRRRNEPFPHVYDSPTLVTTNVTEEDILTSYSLFDYIEEEGIDCSNILQGGNEHV
ncbi:hypothetical protein [Eubacterium sp. AB3007]|uniref:hypothetical protein n=1 Tax=Eubacterium sp. AB3007 TaxID=1392487 RepID=UPI00068AD317|nr:hypothetical protein [Eubacterium sp. AB3007]